MLAQSHFESAGLLIHLHTASRESILHGPIERLAIPKQADRLKRRRQIRAVVVQDRREGAHLRNADWRGRISAKSLVKAPSSNRLAHRQHLRRPLWICNR